MRTVIADRVTDQLVLRNRPDLLAARPLIAGTVSGLVGGEAFATILRAAARDAHRAVFDREPQLGGTAPPVAREHDGAVPPSWGSRSSRRA